MSKEFDAEGIATIRALNRMTAYNVKIMKKTSYIIEQKEKKDLAKIIEDNKKIQNLIDSAKSTEDLAKKKEALEEIKKVRAKMKEDRAKSAAELEKIKEHEQKLLNSPEIISTKCNPKDITSFPDDSNDPSSCGGAILIGDTNQIVVEAC